MKLQVFPGCLLAGNTTALCAQPRYFKTTLLPGTWQDKKLVPQAMNDHGQVVGLIQPSDATPHLFLWDRESGVRDLQPVYDVRCDINNRGQIAGTLRAPDCKLKAFVREPDGTIKMLGSFSGGHSEARAINNRGQVVGRSFVAIPGVYHAFTWDRTNGMRDLGAAGYTASGATAISDTGQVFGYFEYNENIRRQRRLCCAAST